MSEAPRFELDAGVRVHDGGRLLVGGTPPRMVRLSYAGSAALKASLRGEEVVGATSLAMRLEAGGLLHPLPGDGADDRPVTAIVPVLDGGPRFTDLIATLAVEGPVIVVDDGSQDGSGERAERTGARVLRHDSARGPAAARNTGLAAADTEFVAFVDADCEVVPGWRRGLAGMLVEDPGLALIAPRVRSAPGDSALARYEERGSPLDLGPDASLVGPERRVAYVPAAAMVARRDALLDLGGFDESMRLGEDVDMVWRLLGFEWRVRYAPGREVAHRPRPSVGAFARQRAGYGKSAVALVARHGDAAAPLRAGRHSAAIWGATALLGPRALLPALAVSTAIVGRRGSDSRSRKALAEVALRGQLASSAHLARVLVREWLPLGLAIAPFSRRARGTLLAAFLVDLLPALTAARSPTRLAGATALHALDRSAYAAGMWREMARERDFRALRPGPPRSSAAGARR